MANALVVQKVSDVARAKKRLPETSARLAFEALLNQEVEACSEYEGRIVDYRYIHPLIAAVHVAFCDHRPLVLSPDMLWLLILQGLAQYVNKNPELHRSKFVQHQNSVEIEVRRDDFIKGAPKNPWNEVFSEFSAEIRTHIGDRNHEILTASFSTTGPIERAATEIVLMNTVKKFFSYKIRSMCGIPEVTLEGSVSDWQQLVDRTIALGNTYGLTWWTDRLMPTLMRIARNAAGANDANIWKSIYKYNEYSGGPYITGWIADFFPYLVDERNEGFDAEAPFACLDRWGIAVDRLPGSLNEVPFIWNYWGCLYEMKFVAGFIGFTQDVASLAVRPRIGWAVCEKLQNDDLTNELEDRDLLPEVDLPPPEVLQRREDLRYYNSLGSERLKFKCRRENCERGAVKFSVFCRKHHFENVRGRPCPSIPTDVEHGVGDDEDNVNLNRILLLASQNVMKPLPRDRLS